MPRTLIAAITLAAWTLSAHAAPALRHIAIENGEGLEYVRTVPKPVTYKNVAYFCNLQITTQ
jgi:succinate dehydrogenase/fumarate reductase cytochrome b subunit